MNCPNCKSDKVKFLRTYEDWYDGDEDDIYLCLNCNKEFKVYIPR